MPKRNFIKFANKAMEIGKQSGRGLRTIAKRILPVESGTSR